MAASRCCLPATSKILPEGGELGFEFDHDLLSDHQPTAWVESAESEFTLSLVLWLGYVTGEVLARC
jgi:hypothetical protein